VCSQSSTIAASNNSGAVATTDDCKNVQSTDSRTINPDHDSCDTVGAVALDAHGNFAYATSTGGMTAKQFGRVGDSPIVGKLCFSFAIELVTSEIGKVLTEIRA